MCAVETWLNSEIDDSDILLSGWTVLDMAVALQFMFIILCFHFLFCSEGALTLNSS